MTKKQYVLLFMEKLLEVREIIPEVDYTMQALLIMAAKGGFSPYRGDSSDTVQRIREVYGKYAPDYFFKMDYDKVNLISWHFPFIRIINGLDDKYYIHHNMLGSDTIYTEVMIPKNMIIEESQRDIYLRK